MLKTAITHYGPRLTVAGVVGFVAAKLFRRRQEEKHRGFFRRVLAH